MAKVVLPFSMMTLTIFISSPGWNLLILCIVVVMLVDARVPASAVKPYVRVALLLSVVFSLNWLVFGRHGTPILTIGWLTVTQESLSAITTSILRLMILILSSIVLMGITSESELIEGLRKIKIPYVVCFIFMMAIRFFPTLAADMAMIREAQMSRGTEFDKGSLMDRGKKFAAILIPLIVVSFRRVEVISTGLEARAFKPFGSSQRTFFRETPMRLRDKLLISAAAAAVILAIGYQLTHGGLGLAATGTTAS